MNYTDSFKGLYKKIDATSKTRFYASRRLRLHAKFSTYTVVILSLSLILVSLLQSFGLGENISSKYTGLIQVFAATAVLVYSLLIDKNEYPNLSEKMYACASKLGDLKLRLYPFKLMDQPPGEKYAEFQQEYWNILELYETHSNNDFKADNLKARLDMPEDYSIKGMDWFVVKLDIYRMHFLNFLSYPLVLMVLFFVMIWLWFGISFSAFLKVGV
ncbi:SLATT domain-containing protein [Microbulbifer sp. CnH-101-E]|uniref:SLATT domain-containing protein n=1 Tax=unclassified Microbulbifer TaxID=2619833 RepID=UPI00403A44C6